MRRSIGVLVIALAVAGAMLPSPVWAGPAHGTVVSVDPVNYTPNVIDGGGVDSTAIYAFHQVGTTMYAGGEFNQVANAGSTNPSFTRNNLMAFNANTGAMLSFAPNINGAVWAIQSDGQSLWVAGSFTSVNGTPRRGVAKFNIPEPPLTGPPTFDTGFNAQLPSGRVTDMRLAGGRLYIGGNFAKKLTALNPTTGADTGYVNLSITGTTSPAAGGVDTYRFAINPAGTRLVAIGNFTTIAGQARARAFMLNLNAGSAALSPWYYQPLANMCAADSLPAYLRGVDFSPDGSYFVLASTGFIPQAGGVGRDLCDATARFNMSNQTATATPQWINYTGGDTLHSVVATGAAIYVQGHQRWLDNPQGQNSAGPGAVNRPGIGAINPATGLSAGTWPGQSWNPTKSRAVGGKVLYATSAGLWVGSDGERFRTEYRDNIAFCPL